MEIDLFHQKVYEEDGYLAIADYTGQWRDVDIYDPSGKWFGGTGAVNDLSMMSDVRLIIKWHKRWRGRVNNDSRVI